MRFRRWSCAIGLISIVLQYNEPQQQGFIYFPDYHRPSCQLGRSLRPAARVHECSERSMRNSVPVPWLCDVQKTEPHFGTSFLLESFTIASFEVNAALIQSTRGTDSRPSAISDLLCSRFFSLIGRVRGVSSLNHAKTGLSL